MHMIHVFDEDFPTPKFRIIKFSDECDVITVSVLLRRSWSAFPSEGDATEDAIVTSRQAVVQHLTDGGEEKPQETELGNLHTPWREHILHLWNHVFYDVMEFLGEAAMGVAISSAFA